MADLEHTFRKLQENGIKLNPEKCIFGVSSGMLLGFIISERGIEANLVKISAIMKMGSIPNLKGVQKVTECLTVFSHFISRLGEQGLPLYWLLKKIDQFTWTPEAQEALDKLKMLLTKALILVPPVVGEPLLLYVVATTLVVSTALVVDQGEE